MAAEGLPAGGQVLQEIPLQEAARCHRLPHLGIQGVLERIARNLPASDLQCFLEFESMRGLALQGERKALGASLGVDNRLQQRRREPEMVGRGANGLIDGDLVPPSGRV